MLLVKGSEQEIARQTNWHCERSAEESHCGEDLDEELHFE